MFEQQYDSRQGQVGVDDSSTFECDYCHANILSSNQVIHEAVCARQHRNGNERQARPEPIVRQGSSSEISNVPDSMRQPQIRREDRRIVENKMITCPNCEKSVREQNLSNHINNECEGHDKIPCEFCDQLVPMTSYTQHVDNCPRRAQEEQNRRQASPVRNENAQRQEARPEPPRQNERPQENVNRNQQQQQQGVQQGRSRSAEQSSSEREPGGFMDFISNIASAAYNSFTHRNDDQHNEQQQEQQRQQQQQQQQSGRNQSFLSRLLGVPSEEESHVHRPDQRPRNAPNNARQRATTPPVQHPFDPFGLFTDDTNRAAPQRRQNEGYTLMRTVERAPNGSLNVRMRMVPTEQVQGMRQMGPRQPQQMELEDMGPMGLLLNMLSGQAGGMQGMNFGSMGDVAQEGPRGLSPEVLDSLAVVKYDKERNKNVGPEAKSCPICLEEFDNGDSVRYLWCMHRFHMNCVDNWLKDHANCPICKKEFSEAEHNYSS